MLLARLQSQQASWDRHLSRTEAFFGLGLGALAAHAGVLASRQEGRPAEAIVLLLVNVALFAGVAVLAGASHARTSLSAPPEPENVYWTVADESRFEDWADALHSAIVRNRPGVKAKAKLGNWCFRTLAVQTLITITGIIVIAVG